MAFTARETADIEAAMADFVKNRRPSEDPRDRPEIGWRIERQSVTIFSIQPRWNNPAEKTEIPAAKATYIRGTRRWKIYRRRADLKWHAYPLQAEAVLFEEFLALVEEDEICCFWG